MKSRAIIARRAFLKRTQVLQRDAVAVELNPSRFGQICAAEEKVFYFGFANGGVRKSAWLRGVNLSVGEDEACQCRKNIPRN
ncbi:MAG: hypothetical protein OXF94_12315 [Gammaproteobacteria bacterium]|nr:hypothetical protein [Gammaproteobacteria bacterium]